MSLDDFRGYRFRGRERGGFALRDIRAPLLFRILASLSGSLFLFFRVTIIWLGQRILQEMIFQFRSYSALRPQRALEVLASDQHSVGKSFDLAHRHPQGGQLIQGGGRHDGKSPLQG